ncbi:hypothetical protein C8R45DRAFT_947578 [Mycena sanguinolenta]|nr:hypothetical protein C8R45DRAFT_947578 [Mycena sanguinolenta]
MSGLNLIPEAHCVLRALAGDELHFRNFEIWVGLGLSVGRVSIALRSGQVLLKGNQKSALAMGFEVGECGGRELTVKEDSRHGVVRADTHTLHGAHVRGQDESIQDFFKHSFGLSKYQVSVSANWNASEDVALVLRKHRTQNHNYQGSVPMSWRAN